MIALLRSELLRMRSRRMIAVLLIAALTGILVTSVILVVKSHKESPADRAQALQAYQVQLNHCLNGDFQIPPAELGDLTLKQWCRRNITPVGFSGETTQGRFIFALSGLPDILLHTSFLMFLMAIVIGASSIGAEFSAGTLTTLLTWEPRRLRVLLARLLVVAITVVILTLVIQIALSLMLTGVAAFRGSTADTGSPWLHQVVTTIGRMMLMGMLISCIGLAVATIGRSTAAALGGLFVYLVLFENLLRGLRPSIAPLLLSTNVVTFITGHSMQLEMPSGIPLVVTVLRGLFITCLYVGGLLVVAGVLLRARDVN